MKQKFTDEEKTMLVKRYVDGENASIICDEKGISKSTFYSWVKLHTEHKANTSNDKFTYSEFVKLQNKVTMLETRLEILQKVDCNVHSPLKVKLYELEKLSGDFNIRALCDALQVDRGTFYNHIKRNKKDETAYKFRREDLSLKVLDIFESNKQIFGAKKIAEILRQSGTPAGEKFVADLMNEMNLKSVRSTAKRDYIKLSKEGSKNKLNLSFNASRPNEIWVSDITYYKYKDKFYYICAIIDLYARKVISYKISNRQTTYLVTSTLKKSYAERNLSGKLIFHSDRGGVFNSYTFKKLLHTYNIEQSFSPSGSPQHNAVIESFFSSLKREELYRKNYTSLENLKKELAKYIDFYNNTRPHKTNKYKTPNYCENKYFLENSNEKVQN